MEFMPTRDQAWEIVCEFTKSEGLRKHALAVEACVTAYAKQLGEDEHKWGVTALLHDFDWEIHPQLPDHPMLWEPILAERGVDEETRRAILSHADFSGVPRVSPLEKVLYACDELAGFITAISYVKPNRSVFEVDAVSVKKKMKDKAFARAVNRQDILHGAQELGVPLDEHVEFCVKAMQARADALGLAGISATSGEPALLTGHTPAPKPRSRWRYRAGEGTGASAAGTTTESARAECTWHSWISPGRPPVAWKARAPRGRRRERGRSRACR